MNKQIELSWMKLGLKEKSSLLKRLKKVENKLKKENVGLLRLKIYGINILLKDFLELIKNA